MKSKSCVVYAFAHAGATSSIYQKWIRDIEAAQLDVELIPIELPGRGRQLKQEPILNLDRLTEHLALSIQKDFELKSEIGAQHWMTFGHSFGGVLSFAIVNYLYRYFKLSPKKMIISGSIPPCSQMDDGRERWGDEQIFQNIQKLGGTPVGLLKNEVFKKQIIHQFRNDYIIRKQLNNLCNEVIDIDASLIHARSDDFIKENTFLDWNQHLSGDVNVSYIQGGHFSIYNHQQIVFDLFSSELKVDNQYDQVKI